MPVIDLKAARDARDEGMAATLTAQEAWGVAYRHEAQAFLKLPAGRTFTGEHLRLYMRRRGLKEPTHPNAWGALAGSVLRDWLKRGLIVEDGIVQARSVKSHAHHYRRYRRV